MWRRAAVHANLNLLREFFAELEAFIEKQSLEFENSPHEEIGAYLEWYVSVVEGRSDGAKGHVWHASVTVEEFSSCAS